MLLADPPADEATRGACELLGRALYVASGFEDACRSLAFVFKIREPQPVGQTDDDAFNALTKAVLGRLIELNKLIVHRANLKDDYEAMLHAAREARNYIAHEAAGDLDRLIKVPNGLAKWRSILESTLEDVALGTIIVAVLLSRHTAEAPPSREMIDSYPQRVAAWVFDRDTGLSMG